MFCFEDNSELGTCDASSFLFYALYQTVIGSTIFFFAVMDCRALCSCEMLHSVCLCLYEWHSSNRHASYVAFGIL